MKLRVLRSCIPALLLLAAAVGYCLNLGTGTISAFGWKDIAFICPLGALASMIAAKTLIPRALVSIVIALVLFLVFGRAFCSWGCPVPLVARLRTAFARKPDKSGGDDRGQDGGDDGAQMATQAPCSSCSHCRSACEAKGKPSASRHIVLVAALVSTLIFGFPVFCLICPVGLSFAAVIMVIRLFTIGDVTWSVVAVIALLLVEVVFFRKWCSSLCPLSALMSLTAKGNRTFRPHIDKSMCLEATGGGVCGKCTNVCEQGINLRDLSAGSARSECTRCRACVEACPVHAIHMPLVEPKDADVSTRKEDR